MRRRSLLAGFAVAPLAARLALAGDKPWRVSLAGDDFDGEAWTTGVRIELSEGWKTYWRMPGEAGIPPLFGWNGTRGEGWVDVLFPTPSRHRDASGDTVGYLGEVVFPVRVKPGAAMPLNLSLDLFFAVCKDICIPAQSRAEIELGPAMRDPAGSRLVAEWLAKVPVPGELVTAASAAQDDGRPVLVLELKESVDDIFVEAAGGAYFRAPSFAGSTARLIVDNIKSATALNGIGLKLTYVQRGRGLEQSVTVS